MSARVPAATLLAVLSAGAQAAPPDMLTLLCGAAAPEAQRGGIEPIPPLRLLEAAEQAAPRAPRFGLFDRDGDGSVTRGERFGAVRDPAGHCAGSGRPCLTGEQDVLVRLGRALRAFADRNEIRRQGGSVTSPADLLPADGGRPAVQLYCRPERIAATRRKDQQDRPRAARWTVAAAPQDALRLRQTSTSPSKPGEQQADAQETQKLEDLRLAVKGAEAGLQHDSVKGVTTVNVAMTAGLATPLTQLSFLMPFVELLANGSRLDPDVRKALEAKGETPERDTRVVNLTPGLAFSQTTTAGTMDLIGGFTFDLVQSARLARFELGFTPALDLPPFGIARGFGPMHGGQACLRAFVQPRVTAVGVAVLDAGKNTAVAEAGDTLRLGLEAAGYVRNICGPLENARITARYRHLFTLSGSGPGDFGLLSAGFVVPIKDTSFEFGLGYDRGRNLETLQRIDTLSLKVGLTL